MVYGQLAIQTLAVNKVQGDIVTLQVTIQNTGNTDYTFKLGASIGQEGLIWYDAGQYASDGYGDYRDTFIAAGQTVMYTRSLQVPTDITPTQAQQIIDAWVTVKDVTLVTTFDEQKVFDEINVTVPVAVDADILSVIVT